MEEQRLTAQDAQSAIAAGYRRYVRRKRVVVAVLAVVLVAAVLASLSVGSITLSLQDMVLGSFGLAN